MPRSAFPLRLVLLIGVALLALFALAAMLLAADTALSVFQRLRDAPVWLSASIALVFSLVVVTAAWIGWRIIAGPKKQAHSKAPLLREEVERRLKLSDSEAPHLNSLHDELSQMDSRNLSGEIYIALFGDISAGKTALARALTGNKDWQVDVLGGTTRKIEHAQGKLPGGSEIIVADVPGLHGGDGMDELARQEALRAHAIVYVCDGDLTRDQHAELDALLAIGKPVLLALNKMDRYSELQLANLQTKLSAHLRGQGVALTVSAADTETVYLQGDDGMQMKQVRECKPHIQALSQALQVLAAQGAHGLEPARQQAVLKGIVTRLEVIESAQRRIQADATVKRYTRRAIVGAMAAVAPGTDLVIQGALATALLRELTNLYGLGLRDVDLDQLVASASNRVRTTTSVVLAIAGNALKAFPGVGTVSGGLMHALAYGLIFDSLGRAVTDALAERKALDQHQVLHAMEENLTQPSADRLKQVASLAWDAFSHSSKKE